MLLYFVEGFWFILCFMYILKINIFINRYEILLYGNVLCVFINVFIFKIWINFYKKKILFCF